MIDYKVIFQTAPGCYLLLQANSPEFYILDANTSYFDVTKSSADIIGKPLFEAFTDNPNNPDASGVKNLTASLSAVLETKKAQQMKIQRYDTWIDDRFHIKFWKPSNIPVLDEEGNVTIIIHRVQDVTDLVMLRKDLQQQDEATQQQITDAITTTQELERLEISQELHDNINQILNASRLYFEISLGKVPMDSQMIQEGLKLVRKAIEEVRMLSTGLETAVTKDELLSTSLEELLQQVADLKQIKIVKHIDLYNEAIIESKVKSVIIRIIQEQLTNILKHSDASTVFFSISFKNEVLLLKIKDDGKGFDTLKKHNGMGLRNMKIRVALLDGDIMISSSPGGTAIDISIPIKNQSRE